MKTREEEIKKVAEGKYVNTPMPYIRSSFIEGAQWADAHPQSPWRNVMTDEPKKDQDVFVHIPNFCGGEYCKLTYLGNYRWSQDNEEWTTEFYNNEVMWMPIPELQKGCEYGQRD